ncbi:hypothetical protein EYC84_005914 [Monilinia fructicola]|uniref:Uncharacterized protein n=1 Tax=Monilinia fructicola TaxID=38448 RepID=A0A5M9K210_MONFR|nr:hypothetical protein EYC84_005914 [Monilinia fructicola]
MNESICLSRLFLQAIVRFIYLNCCSLLLTQTTFSSLETFQDAFSLQISQQASNYPPCCFQRSSRCKSLILRIQWRGSFLIV